MYKRRRFSYGYRRGGRYTPRFRVYRLRYRGYTRRPMYLHSFGRYAPLRNGGFGGPVPHQPELKAIDTVIADTQMGSNATGTVTGISTWQRVLLNGVVQGTDIFTRIGRKIVMQKLVAKLHVQQQNVASSIATAGLVRLLFVYDAQPNAATPGITDILQGAAPNTTSPMNLNNRERFRLIMDKFYHIAPTVISAAGASQPAENSAVICKKFKTNVKMDTVYNAGNAGTVGDIQSGALWLFYGTNVEAIAGGANSMPILGGYTRVRFYDS